MAGTKEPTQEAPPPVMDEPPTRTPIITGPQLGVIPMTQPPEEFALNWDTEPDPVHVNVVMVRQTQPDVFALVFGDGMNMPGRMVVEQAKRVLYAPIIASLRIPASSMSVIVGAIVGSWNEYVRKLSEKDRGALPEYLAKYSATEEVRRAK